VKELLLNQPQFAKQHFRLRVEQSIINFHTGTPSGPSLPPFQTSVKHAAFLESYKAWYLVCHLVWRGIALCLFNDVFTYKNISQVAVVVFMSFAL